jgi:enamine deaminase RidA (YjgF/YER057c/UK114 family)
MRRNIASGAPWEATVGYSRAVRIGDQIFVAGTTATEPSGEVVGVGDAYTQAVTIFAKINAALAECDATLRDVVRTRMFVIHPEDQAAVGRAHLEALGQTLPAATMVGVAWLAHPDHLVEIEVDAVVMP